MLLGRLYHSILGWFSRRRGYSTEELIERRLGSIVLRGRPDAYKREGDTLEVVERKSGPGPKRGVWVSDMLQVTAYGIMLRKRDERVLLRVEYRSGSRIAELDSEKISILIKIIDDIILVKKYGIVPYANRSPRRCATCPYKDICEEIDRVLFHENLYEPGEEIARMRVDFSFTTKQANRPDEKGSTPE